MNQFDPQVLDRTVIAIPLLREMQEDLRLTGLLRKQFPAEMRRFSTAIEWNRDFPGGAPAARKRIADILRNTKLLRRNSWFFANLDAADIRRLRAAGDVVSRIVPTRFEIIIDLNLDYSQGRQAARQWILENLAGAGERVQIGKDLPDSQYIFASLEARSIQKLVELDRLRAIYHIWPDFGISACINKSVATVKSDAAETSFSADGAGITWAVMDSGIDPAHIHFRRHSNIDPNSPLHRDFTPDGNNALHDPNGHGTHVAGIIAGEWPSASTENRRPIAVSPYLKTESQDIEYQASELPGIRGMAPACRLVSLRVLDENGRGSVSNLIAAVNHVQEKNAHGRRLLIHGVNISLGYDFEPEWFACGQSPLCVEVDRLVRSGVVVVVAAGNTGYGPLSSGSASAGMALTINDPGNADLAITVGSTHRDMPHVYGVSYFSSKGPTGDGRMKPDLVAPGEKIISCAAGKLKNNAARGRDCDYVETSGTSMAASHVSGVIAAFLSVRREFIGHPERVKEIFLSTATDLRRDRSFQGAGMVDLMRAIQSV